MLHEFRAEVTETAADHGGFTARLFPFGEKVAYGRGTVEFQAGLIQVPPSVPLTLDHGESVRDRVGVLDRYAEGTDGAYGTFVLADTEAGRDMRELLKLGALTDVSVGVAYDGNDTGRDITLSGTLDHISIVSKGRFGKADAPSKVLSTHDEKEPLVAENEETTAPVVEFDDSELRSEIVRLSEQIDTLQTRVVEEPTVTLGEYVKTLVAGGDVAEFALAQDDTTGAAGIVPDMLSTEIISVIDTARPFVASFMSDPIGDYGMNVVYPSVTQKPTVGAQANEGDEVATQAFTVGDVSYALETYAGANLASVQVIERSQPSYVNAFYREMAGVYAITTEQAAIATAKTAITQTQLLADASADPAATIAAFAAANTQIIEGVRRPATAVWCGSDRWEQLLSLVDADGRPLVTWPGGSPENAFGLASLSVMRGNLNGLDLILVPNMGSADMIMGWAGGAANLEQSPQQLQALRVDTLNYELGVYGYYQFATKYAAGFVEFTAA